ncbi:MAG: cupin domain-containing protein [Calditrichaeota bacterium]|nr:MAG: cupin domain-containing protein [Calditrichota bacterium]
MTTNRDAAFWIDRLKLIKHPEGGYFREIYRSGERIPGEALPERFSGSRPFCTSIYFLITGEDFSRFHRLQADEIWHLYAGSSLTIYAINPQGILSQILLGEDIEAGEVFQAVVPAGSWFAARPNDPGGYSLVGCTVAPGFEYGDFELGNREALIRQFPQHSRLIEELTRE